MVYARIIKVEGEENILSVPGAGGKARAIMVTGDAVDIYAYIPKVGACILETVMIYVRPHWLQSTIDRLLADVPRVRACTHV